MTSKEKFKKLVEEARATQVKLEKQLSKVESELRNVPEFREALSYYNFPVDGLFCLRSIETSSFGGTNFWISFEVHKKEGGSPIVIDLGVNAILNYNEARLQKSEAEECLGSGEPATGTLAWHEPVAKAGAVKSSPKRVGARRKA